MAEAKKSRTCDDDDDALRCLRGGRALQRARGGVARVVSARESVDAVCVWAGLGGGDRRDLKSRYKRDPRDPETPSMLCFFLLCLLAAASHAPLFRPAAQLRVVARSAMSPVVMQEGEPKKGNCVRATPFFYK